MSSAVAVQTPFEFKTPEAHRNFARKIECEEDGLYFNRYFFKDRFGSKMIIGRHHKIMQETLDRVISGEISRLIINVPPGYTKTEMSSINLIARGIALNSKCRFMHLSYSDSLALMNSTVARGIVKKSTFQCMWPVKISQDIDSKEIWHTEAGGGVRATGAKGQVTGFRAGHMDHAPNNFTGALIIDDPLKPDDAFSDVEREKVNRNFSNTIKSRLAIESVPIVVIMQRIHHDDLSGFLLRGGSGEKWFHLLLPVEIKNDDPYPTEYTHGIPIDHGLEDGWLWPIKHDEQHRVALESHSYTYNSQYRQRPPNLGTIGALWDEGMIAKAIQMNEPTSTKLETVIAIDPATTNTETSDLWGIIPMSKYECGRGFIHNDHSLKAKPKDACKAAIAHFENYDADAMVVEVNQGGDMIETILRLLGFKGKIIQVRASKGKFARAEPASALYGQQVIGHGVGCGELEAEYLTYVPYTGKKSPDRLDAAVWGLTHLFNLFKVVRDVRVMVV